MFEINKENFGAFVATLRKEKQVELSFSCFPASLLFGIIFHL